MTQGTLSFFCGKMGAGKSTKALSLSNETNAILISEDEWLAVLYPNLIKTVQDYKTYSDRLKPQIKKLSQSILKTGQDVVLDFPANTVGQRAWLKEISDEISAPHQLYYLNVPDDICLERIGKRAQEKPERQATDTPEMFLQMAKYFQEPTQTEQLNILKIVQG